MQTNQGFEKVAKRNIPNENKAQCRKRITKRLRDNRAVKLFQQLNG